jgi:Carboxypeptidase regulatory-like domain
MVSSTRQALACIFAIFSVAILAHAQTTSIKEPAATITGTVTIKGKGAPGVIVALRQNDRTSGREYSGPKGVTDDDGKYRIANVPAGSYRILAIAKAYVPMEESDREKLLVVNKGDMIEHIDFALTLGGVITGKVVDAEDHPMVEEQVSVFTAADNKNVFVPHYSVTDDRGVYRIYGLRAGSYRVAAGSGEESFQRGVARSYKRTFHPSVSDPSQATVVEVIEGGETKDVDITFTRTVSTYTVRGRVVDEETGQPIANVNYGITRYQERGTSTRSGDYVTNIRGEFKLEGLSPGKYSLPLSPPKDSDLRFEELPFEIVDQDVTGLVIKANRGASISGVVIFEGLDDKAAREQLGRTFITAWIDGGSRETRNASAQVKEDGSFQIRGVAAGTVTFHVFSNGSLRIERLERDGGVFQPSGMIIREREHIKGIRVIAQYGNASIRGQINVENGTLPPDARFHAWTKPVGADPRFGYSGSNAMPQVDSRGQFVIEGLTSGTYEINAGVYLTSAKLGYLAKPQQVVVAAGSTVTVNITVDLTSTPIKQ